MLDPKYQYKTEDLIYTPNIVDLLTEQQCKEIGMQVVKDYETDLLSRWHLYTSYDADEQ